MKIPFSNICELTQFHEFSKMKHFKNSIEDISDAPPFAYLFDNFMTSIRRNYLIEVASYSAY